MPIVKKRGVAYKIIMMPIEKICLEKQGVAYKKNSMPIVKIVWKKRGVTYKNIVASIEM